MLLLGTGPQIQAAQFSSCSGLRSHWSLKDAVAAKGSEPLEAMALVSGVWRLARHGVRGALRPLPAVRHGDLGVGTGAALNAATPWAWAVLMASIFGVRVPICSSCLAVEGLALPARLELGRGGRSVFSEGTCE